jgi:hypothetical protein
VVDLGRQLDGAFRRFAVWDAIVERFWKINNHQSWTSVAELSDDFVIRFPGERFAEVHHNQRDVILKQAVAMGFER